MEIKVNLGLKLNGNKTTSAIYNYVNKKLTLVVIDTTYLYHFDITFCMHVTAQKLLEIVYCHFQTFFE